MQTIKIVLKPSGSVADFSQDFNIYQGSFRGCIINVAVPTSVLPTNIQNAGDVSTVAVNIATTGITRSGKEFQTDKHNLVWKKDYIKDGVSYKLFGSTENDNLDDFTQYSGAHTLVANVLNIIQGEGLATPVSVITSQECTLNILPSAYLSNEKPVVPSEIDKTNANVNHLLGIVNNLPLLGNIRTQYNIADMPAGHAFTLNGYNEPLCAYYLINYIVPTKPNTTATKSGVSVFSNVSPDAQAPSVIGYQNEYFLSDSGVVVCRTNKFNISQGSIGNYTLLENGAWQIVNQEYIDEIYDQTGVNTKDITELKRLINSGTTYIGEYPSQEILPTDQELNLYVLEEAGREKRLGDEVTFVLIVEGGTDVLYNIKYSEATNKWTATPIPNIEPASNTDLGLMKGTKNGSHSISVDVENGEITGISHNNEKGIAESLNAQINRNSNAIEVNRINISKNSIDVETLQNSTRENAENLTSEISRAEAAEESIANSVVVEKNRAEAVEVTKLCKANINEDYMKDIVFSLNGDTNVATASIKNPVTGILQSIELNVICAAAEMQTGLMTGEMVQALNKAVSDIESLKYQGRQLKSFSTYADAEVFDWDSITNIKINDFFVVVADESRTDPNETGKTTKYVFVNDDSPITINSFQFQTVIYPVSIQIATESLVGGIVSVNTNGYIYVEPNGAAKLVGYDAIITAITNLNSSLSAEIIRAQTAEQANQNAISDEVERATAAEENLNSLKADKTEIPTKTSELTNDSNFATISQLPTKTSELTNDSSFATIEQIPTKTSQLENDTGFAKNTDLQDVIGNKVNISKSDKSFSGGLSARSSQGGAAIGNNAESYGGGAIGENAQCVYGGAVGKNAAETNGGGAVGNGAKTTYGGAVGNGATSETGFSGGLQAKSIGGAVQLGSGTNNENNTFQVFGTKMLNENGEIPLEIMIQETTARQNADNLKANTNADNIDNDAWIDRIITGSVGYGERVHFKNIIGSRFLIGFSSGILIQGNFISGANSGEQRFQVTYGFPFIAPPGLAISKGHTTNSTWTPSGWMPAGNIQTNTGFYFSCGDAWTDKLYSWIAIGFWK